MHRDGRFAAVTNWSENPNAPAPASRGDLAAGFLTGDDPANDFIERIDGELYNGFNLIAFDGEEMVYSSNRTGEVRTLPPGVYGLTNTRLGDRWPKAVHGARALSQAAPHATTGDLIASSPSPTCRWSANTTATCNRNAASRRASSSATTTALALAPP